MTLHQTVRLFFAIFSVALIFVFSSPSDAAQVTAVKGKRVLINLEGEPAITGDIFFLLDSGGKRKAVVKIVKVQGNRALAVLGKGAAQPGYTLKYRPKPGASKTAQSNNATKSTSETSSTAGTSQMYWGVIGGFSQNAMDVELKDTLGNARGSASLSGSGYSLKGLFDYGLFDAIWFRGLFGIEQFNASGPANCGDAPPYSQTCTAEIMYLSLDLWGRYLFSQESFRPWLGGGFSMMFPLSESTTALNPSSVTNTSVMALGAGVDWFTSPTFFVPISVEYGLLPSSDTVSANTIAIRAGAGFSF
jgi:outer membrane protein W